MILVQRRVDRRDLRLPKRPVKRLVGQLRCDTQTCSSATVVVNQGLQPAVLLIDIHIFQLGKLLHFQVQDWSPLIEVGDVIGCELILVCSVTAFSFRWNILIWPEQGRGFSYRVQLRPQTIENLRCARMPLPQWLKGNEEKS